LIILLGTCSRSFAEEFDPHENEIFASGKADVCQLGQAGAEIEALRLATESAQRQCRSEGSAVLVSRSSDQDGCQLQLEAYFECSTSEHNPCEHYPKPYCPY